MLNKLKIVILILLHVAAITAYAQKLPSRQEVSLRAPNNIKIDGKLDEWNNALQANNPANRFFYTISNDDDKLYISVLATDQFAIDKILEGGLTLIVNTMNKRNINDAANSSVTFPFHVRQQSLALRGDLHVFFSYKYDDPANRSHLDAIIVAQNQRSIMLLKQIEIAGLKGITKTILPIDNPEGVKAILRFGEKMACTYELAVPLKYLGLSINSPAKFSYSLRLNGSVEKVDTSAPQFVVTSTNGGSSDNPDGNFELAPSYFWADYTLAKKQ